MRVGLSTRMPTLRMKFKPEPAGNNSCGVGLWGHSRFGRAAYTQGPPRLSDFTRYHRSTATACRRMR